MKIYLLNENATAPTRGSDGAAGLDFYASEDIIILKNGKGLISTGIALEIPKGYYGRLAPRSGLSWKKHTIVSAGVIDEDYRGEIKVVLFNHADEHLSIKKGDRVAQLIIEKYYKFPMHIIHGEAEMNSNRGTKGFGSSGK